MKKSRGKRRTESVLKRQKPRTSRRLGSRSQLAKLALAVALALALGGIAYRTLPRGSDRRAAPAAPTAWQFSLKLTEDLPLSELAQEQIIATARSNIGEASRAELAKTALAIQHLDAYADVRLVKLSPVAIAISVRPRHPVLCVEADRLRYISAQGEVYGQAPEGLDYTCPGPTLTGVFDRGRRAALADDLTLVLSDEDKQIVHEAVELLQEARARGFTFAKLEVRRYRGFFGQLQPLGTEVAMGRSPFLTKLDKLQSILDKLAQKHEQALRIELDYQGKAFIKLKKM